MGSAGSQLYPVQLLLLGKETHVVSLGTLSNDLPAQISAPASYQETQPDMETQPGTGSSKASPEIK